MSTKRGQEGESTGRGAQVLRVCDLYLPLHLFLLLPRRKKQEAPTEGATGALEQVPRSSGLILGGINGASRTKSHKGQLSSAQLCIGLHKEGQLSLRVAACWLERVLFNGVVSLSSIPIPGVLP